MSASGDTAYRKKLDDLYDMALEQKDVRGALDIAILIHEMEPKEDL